MKKPSNLKFVLLFPALCLCILVIFPGVKNLSAKIKPAAKTGISGEDLGKKPWTVDIEKATLENRDYRHVKWTGNHLQVVLMSVKPGEQIDLEIHENVDQFLRIEQGEAQVMMGPTKNDLNYSKNVSAHWAILIPAKHYHIIKNTGKTDLKLYSIYAPVQHPAGKVQKTYQEARKSE